MHATIILKFVRVYHQCSDPTYTLWYIMRSKTVCLFLCIASCFLEGEAFWNSWNWKNWKPSEGFANCWTQCVAHILLPYLELFAIAFDHCGKTDKPTERASASFPWQKESLCNIDERNKKKWLYWPSSKALAKWNEVQPFWVRGKLWVWPSMGIGSLGYWVNYWCVLYYVYVMDWTYYGQIEQLTWWLVTQEQMVSSWPTPSTQVKMMWFPQQNVNRSPIGLLDPEGKGRYKATTRSNWNIKLSLEELCIQTSIP